MVTDKITGLYHYDDYKEQSQKLLKRLDFQCLVAVMNIVNFKYINEHYGFETGDMVLKKVASDFYQKSDRYAIGCRIHSDRFAFLGRAETVHHGMLKAELEKELKKFSRLVAEEMGIVDLRFNMGVYVLNDHNESISECLDKAEVARKKNVEEYQEYVTIYDSIMQDEYREKNDVLYAFQNAVKNKEIKLQLQPVKNVVNNTWQEAEVLTRLIGAKENLISPGVFMPYLEKNGMMSELDCVVVEKSCELLRKWIDDKKKPLPININISGRDITEDIIYNRLVKTVKQYEIEPSLIGLEIKESALFEDGDTVKKRINELRGEGFRVCMDDFGSGYTSITDLANLPVDMIKFAIPFVHNCIGSKKGTTMLKGLIGIFHKIDIPCVCKGIENMLQERLVRECGCQMSQGDVLEAAMDIEKFEKRFIYKE